MTITRIIIIIINYKDFSELKVSTNPGNEVQLVNPGLIFTLKKQIP